MTSKSRNHTKSSSHITPTPPVHAHCRALNPIIINIFNSTLNPYSRTTLYFQQKQTTAAWQRFHERGFSFLPLNKAKSETEETFTTLKRTPGHRIERARCKTK